MITMGFSGATPCAPEGRSLPSPTSVLVQMVTPEQLDIGDLLGEGDNATVHAVQFQSGKFAVKRLKREKREVTTAISDISREIMLMTLMDHPNIMQCKGIGEESGRPFMLLNVVRTILLNELPRDPEDVPFWTRWRELRKWPLSRALDYGIQLGRAIRYCHDDAFPDYRIIHRDMKPANIGILSCGRIVLFDFGIASLWKNGPKATEDAPRKLTGAAGSLRYMAPEVALSKAYSHRADVFSFGTVLWEMLSHQRPFNEYKDREVFKKALGSGQMPEVSPKWPIELQSLMHQLWSLDEGKRPEFREIVPRLEALAASLAAPKKTKGGIKDIAIKRKKRSLTSSEWSPQYTLPSMAYIRV